MSKTMQQTADSIYRSWNSKIVEAEKTGKADRGLRKLMTTLNHLIFRTHR